MSKRYKKVNSVQKILSPLSPPTLFRGTMSDPSSSSNSSSASKQSRVFQFNGMTYGTYAEMVAAKRERNKNYLDQKLSEISSIAGSSHFTRDIGSVASSVSKIKTRKKKREASNSPVRRNPRRSASANASYKTDKGSDSSIQSKESSSYSNSSSGSDDVCIADLAPAEEVAPKGTRAVKKKKASAKVVSKKATVSKLPSPMRRNPRQSTASLATDCSLGNVPSIYSKSRNIQPSQRPTLQPGKGKLKSILSKPKFRQPIKDDLKARKEALLAKLEDSVRMPKRTRKSKRSELEYLKLDIPDQDTRARGPFPDNLLPPEDMKDMTYVLEQIVLEGFRVKKREMAWRNFCTVSGGAGSKNEGEAALNASSTQEAMYAFDRTLYAGLLDKQECHNMATIGMQDDTESEDDLIPKEYLLKPQKHDCGPMAKQVSLAQTDYESNKIDQLWIQEYGDGLDPRMFVDEYLSLNSGEAEKYTSTILQTCWDRAVSAVSSKIAVDLNEKNQTSARNIDPEKKGEVVLDSDLRLSVGSNLHTETMNLVDGVMDCVLSYLMTDMSKIDQGGDRIVWSDVVNVLNDHFQSTRSDESSSEQYANGSISCLLNESTLKSITMRLLDRYEASEQKFPA